jgi:hypothetical protein
MRGPESGEANFEMDWKVGWGSYLIYWTFSSSILIIQLFLSFCQKKFRRGPKT